MGFQSLIGALKTKDYPWTTQVKIKFQSLIGALKTHIPHILPYFLLAVSIPHRCAKNYQKVVALSKRMKFQSLIGALKT